MEQQQEQLNLESLLAKSRVKRRTLLPLWMKIFTWLFMITGALIPIGLIAGVFGQHFQLALYGIESDYPLSATGLFVCLLFLLKGAVAYGLWTEQDWAVNLGIVDAISGIVVCAFVMFIYPFIDQEPGFTLNLRLEPVLLILYLIRLQTIKMVW